MTPPHDQQIDDRLVRELEAYQQSLECRGSAPAAASDESVVDGALAVRLARAQRCLDLLWAAGGNQSADEPGPATGWGELPATVGRFEIESELGSGGFGIVYLAVDPATGRRVALKVPRLQSFASSELLQRFQQEATAAAKLDHPNIVPVLEAGLAGSIPYIVSAYYDGPTLAQWLGQQTAPVAPREAAEIVRELAVATQHAHVRGVLHRDIKPSNILLAPREGQPGAGTRLADFAPKLMDFGLAKLTESTNDFTKSGAMLGTVRYMAPEQARGNAQAVTTATDVYALGVCLYELLTDHTPFVGESDAEVLLEITTMEPRPLRQHRRDVPDDLQTICLKCLARESRGRYRSAGELADDLGRYLAGEPIWARPAGSWERTVKWAKRRPVWALLSAVACASTALLIGGVVYHNRQLDAALAVSEAQRLDLEASRLELRQQVYSSDMRLAQQALEGLHAAESDKLLRRYIPEPGEVDLREFSWGHLWAQTHQESLRFDGQGGDLYTVAYSPDGKRLATAGRDGTVRFWNPKTGKLVDRRPEHNSEVNAIAFSPDGSQLASVSDTGELILWTVEDRLTVQSRQVLGEAALYALCYSPDGKWLAVGGDDGTIRLLTLPAGKVEHELREHTDEVLALAFGKQGRLLFSGGHDGKLLAWKLDDAQLPVSEKLFDIESKPIRGLAVSADGEHLAVAEEWLCVYRIQDFERLARLAAPSPFSTVAFTRDGRTLIGVNHDSACRLWRWEDQDDDVRIVLGARGRLYGAAIAPDQQQFVAVGADGIVRQWPVDVRAQARFDGPPMLTCREAATSSNGNWLLTETEQPAETRLTHWQDDDWQTVEIVTLPEPSNPHVGAVSDDGQWLACSDGNVVLARQRGAADTWIRIGEHTSGVVSLGLVPDAEVLISASKEQLKAWQLKPPALLWEAKISVDNPPSQLRINGPFVSYAAGSTVAVHRRDSGAVVFQRAVPLGEFNDAVVLPDGSELLAASSDRTIYRWLLSSGQQLDPWAGHVEAVLRLSVHPRGQTIASVDRGGIIQLWYRPTAQSLLTLRTHTNSTCLAFSEDGERLISAGRIDPTGKVATYLAPPPQSVPSVTDR